MKERPILFNGDMVRAILDGKKTQTRRVVNFDTHGRVKHGGKSWHIDDQDCVKGCPLGQPGDRLWVRESVRICGADSVGAPAIDPPVWYMADGVCHDPAYFHVRPSIHMPRWASRITLEITDVRVQRLQEISEEDAMAEGCLPACMCSNFNGTGEYTISARSRFADLWNSIYGTWDENPWVWAVSFKRIES